MSRIAFVLIDASPPAPTQRAELAVLFARVLAACAPGDEVIVAEDNNHPRGLQAWLAAAAAQIDTAVLMAGPDAPETPLAADAVVIRPLPLGAPLGIGARLALGLRRAQAEAVLILTPRDAVDPESVAALRRGLEHDTAEMSVAGRSAMLPEAGETLAQLLFRRDFAKSLLPMPEADDDLLLQLLPWRAVLRARDAVYVSAHPMSDRPEPQANAASIFASDRALGTLIAAETVAGVSASGITRADAERAARALLFRCVADHFRTADPRTFWGVAAACPSGVVQAAARWVVTTEDEGASGARALACLAAEPAWRVVSRWQASRLAGQVPGSPSEHTRTKARERWHELRRAARSQTTGNFTG